MAATSIVNDEKRPKKRKRSDRESKESYLQEIGSLEDEINHLEEEIEAQEMVNAGQFSHDKLQVICSQLERSSSSKSARSGRAKIKARAQEETQIEKLKETVEKLETLTGIELKENQAAIVSLSNEINNDIDNNNNKHISRSWRRKISGSCEGLEFTVEFDVKEMEVNESGVTTSNSMQKDSPEENTTATVCNLVISIQNNFAANELKSFIKYIQEQGALQTFFSGLQGYCKWYNHRQKTFQHFKSKYPDTVLIQNGLDRSRTLNIVSSDVEGLYYMITWKIDVNDSGCASPCIDAVVCNSESSSEEDNDRETAIIQSVPQHFRKMLSTVGIEQAIELVIRMASS